MATGYDDDLTKIVEELNRAAPGGKPAPTAPEKAMPARISESLDRLLSAASRQNASDVLLVAGCGVTMRVQGALTVAAGAPLSSDDLRELLMPLLSHGQHDELNRSRSVDFCFVREGIGRFRANIHHQ